MAEKFHGLFPALVTPMTADEEVDYKALADFVDYLIKEGAQGIVPLGSTGEYYALSAQALEGVKEYNRSRSRTRAGGGWGQRRINARSDCVLPGGGNTRRQACFWRRHITRCPGTTK